MGTFRKAKASILHGAGHALRFKGDAYNSFADSIDMFADGVNPRQRPRAPTRVTYDRLYNLIFHFRMINNFDIFKKPFPGK